MKISSIKFKINGRCVNKCSFCCFHSDPDLLEVEDIADFYNKIENPGFKYIIINGGEPTIHPRFLNICEFLKNKFKNDYHLILGTNLIPWTWTKGRYSNLQEVILETFDQIDVGCDDEHHNIDFLERYAPIITDAGLVLTVNVMKDYCCESTKQRILKLGDDHNFNITFSEVCHYYENKTVTNTVLKPCKNRAKHLLINCNGDAFFCYIQEMENPVFNIYKVNEEEIKFYLNKYKPEPYHFCYCCPYYIPESFLPAQSVQKVNRLFKRIKNKVLGSVSP